MPLKDKRVTKRAPAAKAMVAAAVASTMMSCELERAEAPRSRAAIMPSRAVARLEPVEESGVEGNIEFVKVGEGIRIEGEIRNLSPGGHGFHVHEYGDCSGAGAANAGGHYNPYDMPHAGPDSNRRHVGDLGNITADTAGIARIDRIDPMISFEGPSSVVGRALVVHRKEDDFTTQPSGAAGARLACGVIGIAARPENDTQDTTNETAMEE
ncbi:MAG: superoxide dismutase family protein [Chitinivibrionales bacterium]|nr:superoxide dismutase family protein [Chitinivibrionales bacterium]MBD3356239.1 superoxide dismutase family protein [Chitinivibrionales bacterium]